MKLPADGREKVREIVPFTVEDDECPHCIDPLRESHRLLIYWVSHRCAAGITSWARSFRSQSGNGAASITSLSL